MVQPYMLGEIPARRIDGWGVVRVSESVAICKHTLDFVSVK